MFAFFNNLLGSHYTPFEKATKIIELLNEGMSVRAVSRVMDVTQGTIPQLATDSSRKRPSDLHDLLTVHEVARQFEFNSLRRAVLQKCGSEGESCTQSQHIAGYGAFPYLPQMPEQFGPEA